MDIECDSPYSMHCRRDYLNGPYIYSLIRHFHLQANSLICTVRVRGQKGSVIQEFFIYYRYYYSDAGPSCCAV